MSNLRLIEVDEEGYIRLTAASFDKPIDGRNEAIQRLMLGLMNTPGTMVDFPTLGGGVMRLYLTTKKDSEVKIMVGDVIQKTIESVIPHEPEGDEFAINEIEMIGFERLSPQSFTVTIRLRFQGAQATTARIPGNFYGSQ